MTAAFVLQLSILLEGDMNPVLGSSRNPNLCAKKKNHEWHGRTDMVTYEVFKRMYWSHLPRALTKGLCMFFAPLSLQVLTPAIKLHLSHSVNFWVRATVNPHFVML